MADSVDGWETVIDKKKAKKKAEKKEKSPSSATTIHRAPTAPPASADFGPCIVILVGLPGSGKSTFAQALEVAMPHKVGSERAVSLAIRRSSERRRPSNL